MTVARSVSEVLEKHVVLEIEGIDRLYLNLYVPNLQSPQACAHFFRYHRGQPQPSSTLMAPLSRAFVRSIENFARREAIDLIRFKKGERKDEVAKRYLAKFKQPEGILFIGKVYGGDPPGCRSKQDKEVLFADRFPQQDKGRTARVDR